MYQTVSRGKTRGWARVNMAEHVGLNMDARYNFLASVLLLVFSCEIVSSEAPQIVPVRIPDVLDEGQRLLIVCAVQKGSLPISFSWRKDNALLMPTQELKLHHFDDYQEQLQILRLSSEHVGNYTCTAKNLHGSDQISVPIVMKFPPRWSAPESADKINAVAGETVTVNCSVLGHPKPSVLFHKGNF